MDVEHIPATLKDIDQWVCWRYEDHSSRTKPMKVPYCARTGERASVQDPQTWDTFEEACNHFQQDERYTGVGFVLTRGDGIVGVDVDDCIDDAGDLAPLAQQIVDLIDSYSEISPSGRGIRIFALADLKDFGGKQKGGVELYNFGRYLTVTGHHLEGTPRDVQERLPQVRQLYRQYLKPTRPEQQVRSMEVAPVSLQQDDNQVLERMFAGKGGDLYRQIFEGDSSGVYSGDGGGEPDESRADVLLFNGLAFYTYQDPEQMRRILLASPRARQRFAKWHKRVQGERIYLDYQIADSISYTRKR